MNERPPEDNQGRVEGGERAEDEADKQEEQLLHPRIYVASLADYNDGRMHGAWIDADQTEEELEQAVKEMLDSSTLPGAEEWAIHASDGFGMLDIDEFESFEYVAKVAAGIAKHGAAFAAWASHVGTDSERLDQFEDAYVGEWESEAAYAEETLEDLGIVEEIMRDVPKHFAPYVTIDYAGYARDLAYNGDIVTVEKADGGIYVYWNW